MNQKRSSTQLTNIYQEYDTLFVTKKREKINNNN